MYSHVWCLALISIIIVLRNVQRRLLSKGSSFCLHQREADEFFFAFKLCFQEFQMKMESLQQRREELERKEYQLKESLLKFDKFLKVHVIRLFWKKKDMHKTWIWGKSHFYNKSLDTTINCSYLASLSKLSLYTPRPPKALKNVIVREHLWNKQIIHVEITKFSHLIVSSARIHIGRPKPYKMSQ